MAWSLTDPEHWSDGGCTWLPDHFWKWDWQHCCIAHDWTDNNVDLASCLVNVFGQWSWPLVLMAIIIMLCIQPIYRWMHYKGWVE